MFMLMKMFMPIKKLFCNHTKMIEKHVELGDIYKSISSHFECDTCGKIMSITLIHLGQRHNEQIKSDEKQNDKIKDK